MDLYQILKEENTKVKDNTIRMYARTLEKIKKDCSGDSMYKFLNKPEKVFECLSDNPNSRKTAIVAIIALLKLKDAPEKVIEEYRKEQMKAIDKVNEHYKSGEKSDKQKENWLSVDDLETILTDQEKQYDEIRGRVRGDLKPNTYLDTQNYILLKIHLDYPIRNDLADTKIITVNAFNKMSKSKQREGNYLVLNKTSGKFVLNEYKTDKHYGQKEIELNKELVDTLNTFIKWRAKHGYANEFLLVNKFNKPMTANNITKSFLRLFSNYGKSISTTMIRHIILTEKFGEKNKEKEEMADIMMNSTKTIDEKYIKNKDS